MFSVIVWRHVQGWGGGEGGCHFEMQCVAFTATLIEVTIMQDDVILLLATARILQCFACAN